MLNKDDLIIPVNEYVSAATINLDCIDVCENIVGQLVYLHECVKNIDIVMLQGCFTRMTELLDEIRFEFNNDYFIIVPVEYDENKSIDCRIPMTLISKNKMIKYKKLSCSSRSEYFADVCTYGVAEFKNNIKVRILNLDTYCYIDGKKRMSVEWFWERGAEYEVRNTGKNSFNASDENVFLIACAIPHRINTTIDENMVCIGKSEQGKKGSSSRLYIDKHTVFTNYITQEKFYMDKNLFENEIIGCSISADVKIVWSGSYSSHLRQ